MKRIVSAAAAATVLGLIATAAAPAAHHGHRHHRAHHAQRHARHAHLVRFGHPTGQSTTGSASTGAPTGTAGALTTPTDEAAGKVLTFENGVLTIELTGGSKVSGQVAESTRLICLPVTPPTPTGSGEDDQGGGDDQSGSEGDEHGGPSQPASQQPGGGSSHEDQHRLDGGEGSGESDDMDDDDGQPPRCTTAALTPGTPVREAELNVSSSGAIWERIILVQ